MPTVVTAPRYSCPSSAHSSAHGLEASADLGGACAGHERLFVTAGRRVDPLSLRERKAREPRPEPEGRMPEDIRGLRELDRVAALHHRDAIEGLARGGPEIGLVHGNRLEAEDVLDLVVEGTPVAGVLHRNGLEGFTGDRYLLGQLVILVIGDVGEHLGSDDDPVDGHAVDTVLADDCRLSVLARRAGVTPARR